MYKSLSWGKSLVLSSKVNLWSMMDVEARVGKLKNKGDGEEESRCGAGHEPVRAGRERGRGRGGGRGGDTSFQVELTLKKKN